MGGMFNPLRPGGGSGSAERLRVLADEELMQLVYRSKADAFEVIYDRHADAAFSLAYRMCAQRALAEDVVQEAFLSLWRSRSRYDRNRGSVRTWVLGIVHNRAIDALRRRAVRDRGLVERRGHRGARGGSRAHRPGRRPPRGGARNPRRARMSCRTSRAG